MYKKNVTWNLCASILNAAEAVLLSMIVTRITNLDDAGILSLAFATGNLLLTIGKFGVKNFQATDTHYKYSYSEYFTSRLITVGLMIISILLYVGYNMIFSGKEYYDIFAILAICCIYVIEAVEDVIWGEYQRKGILFLGAWMFICRWTSIIAVFTIMIFITHDFLLSLWSGFVVSLVVFAVVSFISMNTYHSIMNDKLKIFELSNSKKKVYDMLKETLPLFLVGFLTYYINNSPKYALGSVASNDIQACYGFVAMPIFVISLINSMIYQPDLMVLSENWLDGKVPQFRKRIRKQFIFTIILGLVCVIGAAILGIPVLSVLYNANLQDYWMELVVLQIAGIFMAISMYFCMVHTIFRKQKWLLCGYIAVAIFALITMKPIAIRYGTMGVANNYLLCMLILSIIFTILYVRVIKSSSRDK